MWVLLQWTWKSSCLFEILISVLSDVSPEVRLLGHMVVLLYISLRILHTVFHSTVPFYISISHVQEFQFFHIFVNTCYFIFVFNDSHPNRCERIISLWFWFPWWLERLNILSYVCWPFVCLLWRNVFSSHLLLFSCVWLFATPWTAAHQASLPFTNSWSLLKLMSSSSGKNSTCNAGDRSSIPGSGRSAGEGKGYPLQYSSLENSLDWGAWQVTVHGVTKSWTWLSDLHLHIESVMSSYHLILCRPLLLLSSIFPSIRVFSNESTLHIRWLKYWSFSFSINLSNAYLGLISFKMDWFNLLAGQGTLKSLLQHHSLKASILQHSVFFIV